MKQLNKLWRVFGTGFSFAVFGLGGLFAGFLVFPLVFLFVRDHENRTGIARRFIGSAFSAFIWMMKALGVISYEIRGVENAGSGHNQLIIANHPTLIDVVFLISLFPLADCVVKKAVINNPFMRGVVVPAKYIPNDDSGYFIHSCVARLKSGCSLVLFPEGTRSVYGQPLEFKLGAASIAIRSEAQILPVIIQCTQPKLLAKHEPWYKVPNTRPSFLIRVQRPVSSADLVAENLSPREATHALNRAFLKIFTEETA